VDAALALRIALLPDHSPKYTSALPYAEAFSAYVEKFPRSHRASVGDRIVSSGDNRRYFDPS